MHSTSDKVLQLRQLLADRFGRGESGEEAFCSTGLSALDEIEIPKPALTKIVS